MNEVRSFLLEDRGVLELSGSEARSFLQGLITQNIDLLTPDGPLYSALLTPQGKFLFDFFLWDSGDVLFLDVAKDQLMNLARRLLFYKLRADVNVGDASKTYNVWASTGVPDGFCADPRLDGLGGRALVRADDPIAVTDDGGNAEWRRHRLELSVTSGGELTSEKNFPIEANLDLFGAIDFQKGCFVGQEVASRTKRRGTVRKRIVRLVGLPDAPIEKGTAVVANERTVGQIVAHVGTSGMALMKLDALDSDLTIEGHSVTADPASWLTEIL